ncbi:LysR family transcriptional regulator [Marinagarivorans algicola]|uniref:LysR family transcriptional regulator n=1 Tax=Marinagarivorans algicola TaxID=1513270 RepID=UPI001EE498FC|nr:LysR family transcriptional regulator [Marinagarivorans algicola]
MSKVLLEDLQVVLKVAEFRSITKAAAHLDMRMATASAALKRAEAALGAELFIRTTRQIRLSSAGERYLPECEKALLLLDQAKQAMCGSDGKVEGEVRLSLSSDLGRNVVMPWLDDFMDAHPHISLKATISDSTIDFYRDSVDMALRYGPPKDSNLYGFKICDVPGVLCATQAYLAQQGTPAHPHDLATHNGLFYQLHDVIYNVWAFTREGEEYTVKMRGNRASNDGDLVRRWCVAGKGVAVKSCLDMCADLLAGRVVNVLPHFTPRTSELWLICPSRQSITPAMRLLRDAFKAKSALMLEQLAAAGVISTDKLKS